MPLQRHEALRPLSRDHHIALQLARGLQKDASPHLRQQLPRERNALVAHVQRVFGEELALHFDAEDRVLAPAVTGKSAELDRILSDIEVEHGDLTALAASLSDPSLDDAALAAALDRFGRMLEDHVRSEERECYARIQEVLDEASLRSLGQALERHMVFHGKKCTEARAMLGAEA